MNEILQIKLDRAASRPPGRATHVKSYELEDLLTRLSSLTELVEACAPQTPLIRVTAHLAQAASELEKVLAWARRREAEKEATDGN